MKDIKQMVRAFGQDESGQDLIEYALVAGLIGLAAVAGLGLLSTAISGLFSKISSSLTKV